MTVVPIKPKPEPEVSGILEARAEEMERRSRDVGHCQLPWRMTKPTIYFAGRMDSSISGHNTDWRKVIDGFVSGADMCSCPESWLDRGTFIYGGPFSIDDTGGHSSAGHCSSPYDHRQIWDVDKSQIERADLVFAYIQDACAHGTLVEIGYAAAKGKPVVIGFSRAMRRADYDELWLCRMTAAEVYLGTPGQVWRQVRRDWIIE